MPTTFRQMMNRVLTNLGENEVEGNVEELSDSYELLVRNIINQIKEEIEDAHNWRALQSTVSVTVAASAESGTITGTNERSRLVRVFDGQHRTVLPMVHNVTDANSPFRMAELDLNELLRRRATNTSEPNAHESGYFALDQGNDTTSLVVYETCSTAQTIEARMVIPQDRFAADSSDFDSNITIPSLPLELGATYYAFLERGEELGPNALFSAERYKAALDAAIARDSAEQGDSNELVAV